MRFYGLTAQAQATTQHAANAVKLIEWFGGKADGKYTFQKLLFKDIGSGFGVKSLFERPRHPRGLQSYSDIDMFEKQQKLAQEERRGDAAGSANGTRSTARRGSRRCSASHRSPRRMKKSAQTSGPTLKKQA